MIDWRIRIVWLSLVNSLFVLIDPVTCWITTRLWTSLDVCKFHIRYHVIQSVEVRFNSNCITRILNLTINLNQKISFHFWSREKHIWNYRNFNINIWEYCFGTSCIEKIHLFYIVLIARKINMCHPKCKEHQCTSHSKKKSLFFFVIYNLLSHDF